MDSKQMRVSHAVYDEISRLSSTFGIDRQTIINTAIALLGKLLDENTNSIEIVCEDNSKKTISIPIVIKKK